MSTSRVGTASFFELAAMMTMKRVHFREEIFQHGLSGWVAEPVAAGAYNRNFSHVVDPASLSMMSRAATIEGLGPVGHWRLFRAPSKVPFLTRRLATRRSSASLDASFGSPVSRSRIAPGRTMSFDMRSWTSPWNLCSRRASCVTSNRHLLHVWLG